MSNRIEIAREVDKSLLKGIVDTHIHTAPDIRERKFNDLEMAKEAEEYGVKAIVIKSHVVPTAERAAIAQTTVKNTRVYGGLALNYPVGGLNIYAVENAIRMGAKITWMPTLSSSHQHKKSNKPGGIEVIRDGKVVEELREILDMIASNDVVLSTGHLSPKEQLLLVKYASQNGVRKIIVAHPELTRINMSLEYQKELSKYGVYFERCYTCNLEPESKGYRKNVGASIHAIKELGYESTIIASDLGQNVNPSWSDAMADYIGGLHDAGFSKEQIRVMTSENALSIL